MAAGGFVIRSLEAMLKECSGGKKYPELYKAIQDCLDGMKEAKQEQSFDGSTHAMNLEGKKRPDGDVGEDTNTSAAKGEAVAVQSLKIHQPIVIILAQAGRVLEEMQAELLLQPLRLAFETKNIKLVELALDCLHKLIAYNHLEGDLGLEGGKNGSLFMDILNKVFDSVDTFSSDSTILQVLKVLLTAVSSTNFRVHGEQLLGVIKVCYNIAIHSKSPMGEVTSKSMLSQMISIVFRRMELEKVAESSSFSLHAVASSDSSSNTNNAEISLSNQVEMKFTLEDVLTISSEDEISYMSIEEIQQLAGNADIKGLEAILDKAVRSEDGKEISRGIELESMNVGERDALLLFRTLCEMGMNEEADESTTKTRILSLELLQGLMEGVSLSFTEHSNFIDSVKAYLSYSLLRASVSSSTVIFQYATGIFAALLMRFRNNFKGEIGMFFPLIILRALDNFESPLSHRTTVLRVLQKVCKDPQTLADIYVNYDCDLRAPNLFERMVNALSRIAQATTIKDPNPSETSQSTSKASSLQCLVSVLKSLVDWEKMGRETKKHSRKEVLIDVAKKQEDGLNRFEMVNAHNSTLDAAISEFNRKPSKGIEYLLSNNLVENTASSVAQFLKNTPNLYKVMVGEYLGQNEEFPLAVMHAYFESMNLSGLKFDIAIHEFLQGFQFPGEAHKIDRFIEKFAERYCIDNPGLFKNADTAYVLAYAVMVLKTDVLNHVVQPKMSKSDFIRINSVSDTGERASLELLEEIYDSIVNEEIKMKDEITNTVRSSSLMAELGELGHVLKILNLPAHRRKSEIDTKKESENIKKQIQDLLQNQGAKRGFFCMAQQVEIVRPMVEAVGWPLLATFSVTMEEGDSIPRILLCMEGFKAGIHITYVLGMDTMRYAFLTSLVRFTFLHSPKEMRSKNVEALRTLLSLCNLEIDALQDTWNAVLECVSRLEYISSTSSVAATVMQGANQVSRDPVLQSLKELAGKPAEQVFLDTIKLPNDAIIEFFNALCGISSEELKQRPPRVFSLQKLVEISYYNMARIHLVWARIWCVLAQHFVTAGSHYDEKVAIYAIDSLRQLGMKYLERSEPKNFTFQNDILKPFVILMRNSTNQKIRSLIVNSIVQMIKSRVATIKSGWRSVFMIFTASTDDDLESVVDGAFENIEQVILENFDQIVSSSFMDCVNCLIGFANNKTSPSTSLKAIALLRLCENRLAEDFIPSSGIKIVNAGEEAGVEVTEHYWFPMLAGLSDLTLDSRSEVRNCALEVLFDLLNERGHKFSSTFWKIIFNRVLFPIFDHVRYAGKDGLDGPDESGDEWLRDTSIHSLNLLCDLFNTFYKEVSFMLPPLLSLLLDCAKKTDQTVVSISLGALVHLIEVGGHQFSYSDWDALIKNIREASYTTQPLELLNTIGLEISKNQMLLLDDFDVNDDQNLSKDSHNSLPSPSGTPKSSGDAANIQRSQTFGQRIMGNMMDNIFLRRSLTPKQKNQTDSLPSSSPANLPNTENPDATVPITEDMTENPTMEKVRGKCITQLLLLGALDSIQKSHWSKLATSHKIAIIELLASLVEFAASYNSSANLRIRMHQIPSERPPLNLLHQELKGTSMYLEILHKSTELHASDNGSSEVEEKLNIFAEEKLVSLCEQILKEVSDLQLVTGDAANGDIHRVLDLRAPIIVKVLDAMCSMNSQIFKRHLEEFYPLIATLICCDQINVRGALADLISTQLTSLLP